MDESWSGSPDEYTEMDVARNPEAFKQCWVDALWYVKEAFRTGTAPMVDRSKDIDDVIQVAAELLALRVESDGRQVIKGDLQRRDDLQVWMKESVRRSVRQALWQLEYGPKKWGESRIVGGEPKTRNRRKVERAERKGVDIMAVDPQVGHANEIKSLRSDSVDRLESTSGDVWHPKGRSLEDEVSGRMDIEALHDFLKREGFVQGTPKWASLELRGQGLPSPEVAERLNELFPLEEKPFTSDSVRKMHSRLLEKLRPWRDAQDAEAWD